MIKESDQKTSQKTTVNIDPSGRAELLAIVEGECSTLNLDFAVIEKALTAKDHTHLVLEFTERFGSFFELVSNQKITLNVDRTNTGTLFALAKHYCEQHHLDFAKIEKRMAAKDHLHMLRQFDKHFGAFIDLVSNDRLRVNACNR